MPSDSDSMRRLHGVLERGLGYCQAKLGFGRRLPTLEKEDMHQVVRSPADRNSSRGAWAVLGAQESFEGKSEVTRRPR